MTTSRKWLNYHHLYYFKVIASEGSISRAAQKLRLGQPTLSAQLKQFEEALGVRLFEREHKKLHLTESGKAALNYADEIFRLGNEMVEMLEDRLPANRVHVQVGALDSVPKELVSQLAQSAYRVAPCSVSILENSGTVLLRELRAHRIDLILMNYAPNTQEAQGLYVKKIAQLPILLCGARKYAHLKKDFPASLAGEPLILPTPHSQLRRDLDHFFATQKIAVHCIAETQDTSLQRLMGMDGVGLIPISAPSVQSQLKTKDLTAIGKLPGVFEEIFLITASRKIENPIAQELMKTFTVT